MRRSLRSWFAWRFSLTRLVVAMVFLGAFVGLNVSKQELFPTWTGAVWTFRGWPLPITCQPREWDPSSDSHLEPPADYSPREWAQWTHQTYRLAQVEHFNWLTSLGVITWDAQNGTNDVFTCCAVIDALFALTILALILFLQIPPRKVAAREGGT